MRSTLLELEREISDLRTLVQSIAPVSNALKGHSDNLVKEYLTIRRRFDNAAFVVGLYAAFEKYIENIVRAYAVLVASKKAYINLNKGLVNKHEQETARILYKGRLGEGRYKDIKSLDVVKNLHDCMSGNTPYKLNEVALVSHDLNFRKSEINKIFKVVGVDSACELLLKSRELIDWYSNINGLDPLTTLEVPDVVFEQRLEDLIERRNSVAHRGGNPDDLHGPNEMVELIDFIHAVAKGLHHLAVGRYLQDFYLENGGKSVNTSVLEGPFKNGHVLVIAPPKIDLSVGQAAFCIGTGSALQWGRITELKVSDQSVQHIDAGFDAGSVGIYFDFKCPKIGQTFLMIEEDPVVWTPIAFID